MNIHEVFSLMIVKKTVYVQSNNSMNKQYKNGQKNRILNHRDRKSKREKSKTLSKYAESLNDLK